MSELIWVAVPGGINRKAVPAVAVLRVVILPRLSGISFATSGMEHWPPQALTNDPLAVHFSSSPEAQGRTVSVPPPHLQAQSGLWEELFGTGTFVTPAQGRSRTIPDVDVTKTSEDARAIKTTFDNVARTPISETSSEALDPVIRRELSGWSGRLRGSRRSNNGTRTRKAPSMDFHRSLALLREHPAVLRALGLIFELKLPESQLLEDASERFIRVVWPGAAQVPGLPEVVSPWTEFGREFFPASTANIHAGMVTLTDEFNPPATPEEAQWEIVTVDVDNGVSRLRDAAGALQAAGATGGPEPEVSPEQTRVTLPALRTAGLLLVRKGRQEEFTARRRTFERNATRSSMMETVLTADDLVLGYRLDISRSAGKWFSLHRRTASYHVNGITPVVTEPIEEGHLKAHAAVDDGEESGLLRADEVVARWSGWSLAVRQPSLNGQDGRVQPERRLGPPFDLSWDFSVPEGSLPPLRFTSRYRIRARVADLAGGGLEFDDPAADRCATPEITYRRYEPIPSPEIRLPDGADRTKLDPSDSDVVIVIRSDGASVAAFQSQNPGYTLHPSRVLLPPRAILTIAEQHGMFDRPEGFDKDDWEQQTWKWVSSALAADPAGGDALLPDPAAGGVCVFICPEPGGFPPSLVPHAWEEPWPDLIPKQILLRERPEGVETANPLRWVENGTRLEVSLAKAEQVRLEISCRVRDNFLDHFSIHDPLEEMFESIAQSGRHPLVTPPRTVILVHAVRRPLKEPAGRLRPQREPGQTFALLDPIRDPLDEDPTSNPALLNVDPKSTGQVELTAAWTEHNDEVVRAIEGARVQTVRVNRGDEKFRDTLRHEFGDTRHRTVTYTVTTVSRFRSFFREGEDPEAFLARKQLPEPVNLLSTARPPALVVLSTRPAFGWEETVEGSGTTRTVLHRRRGGGLRVELERPWFQTGEGEQLAVLVARDVVPPEAMWSFLTQVGRDPIWDTPLLNRWPTASMFRGHAGEPQEQVLQEASDKVVIVPYAPWFHDGRWYVDIALPDVANASYCPIVQLALSRYQPDSLTPDLRLSQMVRTEMVPLLPERTLTVAREGANVTLTLQGLGPLGLRQNRVEAILETCQLPPGVPASAVDLIAFEPPTDGTLAWVAVPGQVRQSQLGSGGLQLTIPEGSGAFRVRVREVELVGSETGVAPLPLQTSTLGELTERVVFADILPLAEG